MPFLRNNPDPDALTRDEVAALNRQAGPHRTVNYTFRKCGKVYPVRGVILSSAEAKA